MTGQIHSKSTKSTQGNLFTRRKQAREKATTYKDAKLHEATADSEPSATEAESPAPRSEMEWNDLISHRIDEAIRNGAFDNLRNAGKPLPAKYNPHVPADQQMANDLLANNGLAPFWITERSAMLRTIEDFRAKFAAIATTYRDVWQNATDVVVRQQTVEQWQQQLTTWQDEIRLLNQRIEVINLQQPIARLEVFKLILDEELQRVEMTRHL